MDRQRQPGGGGSAGCAFQPGGNTVNAPAASAAITRALELLGRASADWRNGTADVPGALQWPAAVNLARREPAKAQSIEPSHQERKNGDRGALTRKAPHSGVGLLDKTHAA